jgi:hypothetical protein
MRQGTDGRHGGGRKARPVREIPFNEVEQRWRPSPLDSFIERHGDDYVINVLTYASLSPAEIRVDLFRVAADGTVLSAPRGYAKDYRPGRITGMSEAYAKYAPGDPS